MFPEGYRKQIFVAEHGSWNREVPIGYRVSLVKRTAGGELAYEVFASGWLIQGKRPWGRPVDILNMPDGSLLISDDYVHTVYRIRYDSKRRG